MIKDVTERSKLVIVPTPIGNLGDMTFRAMEALKAADVIFAEDTRVTLRLLSALGIEAKGKVQRLDENVMASQADQVADLVESGKGVAYCSDAGMPGVSDPGGRLISLFRERDLPVEVLPGPSASILAYVSSAPENPRFYFGGFLPRKDSQKSALLEGLKGLDASLVFYESPKRLSKSLAVIADVFPMRKVTVCRELTKMHEEVSSANSADISRDFHARDEGGGVKGECAIVIEGPNPREEASNLVSARQEAARAAADLAGEGVPSKEAVGALMRDFAIGRNLAYELFLDAKRDCDDRG